MTDSKEHQRSDSFADCVDEALVALWHGSSDGFDRLIGDADADTPGLGALFHEAVGLHRGTQAGLREPGDIENYRLIREIGRGGMGVIYEVEQIEPPRRVAVKVIQAQRQLDAQAMKLFQREIHALALLRHPHIAAIHEAGRTSDGHHFFAMEYVSGAGLLDYVRGRGTGGPKRPLSTEDRLRLFIPICRAIHYAHQRGVIHRDLKPSNIIVDSAGEPKVLDFGLARITDSDVSLTATMTEAGRVMGTLPYMSPEQACGNSDDIDTRTDVYALGVILYEIVLDRLPYNLKRGSLPEAVRTICNDRPDRPSSINRTVRGDIETILLKPLEKDPDRRYHSAAALADDLERYLQGAPILARPPSAMYQLRKLAQKHKLAVIAATALLLVTTIVVSLQGLRIATERDRAEESASRAQDARSSAQAVTRFFQQAIEAAAPESQASDLTVAELLAQASADLAEGLNEQPIVRAAVHHSVGASYQRLQELPSARTHLQEALSLREQHLGVTHLDTLSTLDELAGVFLDLGEFGESERLYNRAVSGYEAIGEVESAAYADTLNNFGVCLKEQGKYAEAVILYQDSLRLRRSIFGDTNVKVDTCLNNLATLYQAMGRYQDAEPLLRETLARARQRFDGDHPKIALGLGNLGALLLERGDLNEAEELLSEALRMRRRIYGDVHTKVAQSAANLGLLLSRDGRPGEARPYLEEAMEIDKRLLGSRHPSVGIDLNALGHACLQSGAFEQAEAYLREALEIARENFDEPHPQTAATLANLAGVLREGGKLDAAAVAFEKAIELLRSVYPEDHPRTINAMQAFAETQISLGGYASAIPIADDALASAKRRFPPSHPIIARIGYLRGVCAHRTGQFPEAEPLLLQGLDAARSKGYPEPRHAAEVIAELVEFYDAWGKNEQADRYRALLPGSPSTTPASESEAALDPEVVPAP